MGRTIKLGPVVIVSPFLVPAVRLVKAMLTV